MFDFREIYAIMYNKVAGVNRMKNKGAIMLGIHEDDIGKNIKKHRNSKKMSRAGLGELVGVSGQAIYQYESGRRSLKFEMIEKIAKALDVPVDSLLGNYNFVSDRSEKIKPMPIAWSIALKLRELFLPEGEQEIDEEIDAILKSNRTQMFLYGFFMHLKRISENDRAALMHHFNEIIKSDVPLKELQRIEIVAERLHVLNEKGLIHANRLIEDVCELPKYRKDGEKASQNAEKGDDNAQEDEHKD